MRLIDADELLEKYESYGNTSPIALTFIDDLNEIPTVEQKHGHWIEELASQHGNTYDGRTWTKYKKYRCSYCGITNGNRRPDYCPHCGAKMDEVSE